MTAVDVHGAALEIAPDGEFGAWLDPATTAVISIDMHQGHLSEDPECPCPAPRGRQVIAPIDAFHRDARALGVPIIHVRSELRASGVDDLGGTSPSAWRRTFPQHVGEIPGASDHALAGSRWTEFATDVQPEDEVVTGKKRLSAFYPTDLDFLLRQMGVRAVVLDGIMADCCVLNTAFRRVQPRLPRDGALGSRPRHGRGARAGGARDGVAAPRARDDRGRAAGDVAGGAARHLGAAGGSSCRAGVSARAR
ncbi:isochorismatase family cysteine hydrolase [Clavibacter phaseoli]|uniref:isochorismatase family cysteine hydrolase n=1 Tax=Clavibacter phaseoli TaxID=1734031 RepID=UPI001F44B1DC|nr:cysteine hydrolase family protein [Clavibacter phaseoli]